MSSTLAPVLCLDAFAIANPDVPGPALINNYRACLVASLTLNRDRPVSGLPCDAFSVAAVEGPAGHRGAPHALSVTEASEPTPGMYVLTLGRASRDGIVRGSYALALEVRSGAPDGGVQHARAIVRLEV